MTNYEYTISSSNYTTAHTIEMTTSDTVTITGVTDVENIYGLYNSDPTANAPTGAPTGYQTSAYWSVSKTVTNSGSDYNGRMFNTNGAISLPVGTHTFITSRRCLISEDEFKGDTSTVLTIIVTGSYKKLTYDSKKVQVESAIRDGEGVKISTNYAKKATTLAGYGITDAKIENGTITLGSNTITPLSSSVLADYVQGPSSSTADHIATYSSATGKVIKDSGFTIGKSVPSNAVFTDVSCTAVSNHYTPSGGTSKDASGGTDTNITNLASGSGVNVVTGVTVDAAGHVTGVSSKALRSVNNTYTVNNATLTIQKNSSNVATFTANASSDVTANITVPTKVSELTNDSGFITSSGSCNYATSSNYANSAGYVSLPYINCTTVAQSSVGNSDVGLTWNSVAKSPNNNTVYTYSNGIITVKQTGRYFVNAQIYGQCSSASMVEISVWKNGSVSFLADNYVAVTGKNVTVSVSGVFAMNANEYVQIKSWCENGTFTLSNNYGASGFEILRVQ